MANDPLPLPFTISTRAPAGSRPLMSIMPLFPGDRVWRGALLLAIVVIHLLLLLQFARRPLGVRVERPATMSMFTIPLANARGASAEHEPERVPLSPTPMSTMMSSQLPDGADLAPLPSRGGTTHPVSSASVESCLLDQDVGRAIGRDPAAMREIEALSSDVRMLAGAIFVWNGRWLETGSVPADTSNGSLRHAVERVIADASADCRDAVATGPHFVPIPVGSRTMMIVIGSGTWHWADLVAPSLDCRSAAPAACSQQ